MIENVKALRIFFKRQNILRKALTEDMKITKVRMHCETNKMDGETSIGELKMLHPYVVETLEGMVGSGS